MTSQESNDEMTKLRAENEELHQQIKDLEEKLRQQQDERLKEAIKQVEGSLTEKRHKETLKYMVENAAKKWPAELYCASIYLLPPTNVSEAAKVEVGSYVENRWMKLEVPLAHLERFVEEKVKRNFNIRLEGLQVTEEIIEKLPKIQPDEASFLVLEGADLSQIPNATLLRLAEKFTLCCIRDTVLPTDLDTEAMLEKCKRNGTHLNITASRPVKDFFAFGIDSLADFAHSSTNRLTIHEDYIQGSWHSLYEKLRDDFIADPQQRDYRVCVDRYSKTATPRMTTRDLTITKRATGERLTLHYQPSHWDEIMKRYVQYVHIDRRPRPHNEHIDEEVELF